MTRANKPVELTACSVAVHVKDRAGLARIRAAAHFHEPRDINSRRQIMDRKAKIREYKDTPRPMGIYQIRNRVNGKILIGSSVNLPAILNRCKAELKMGSYRNIVLQKEWKQFGSENFELKELEILEQTDDPTYDYAEDLHTLEELWVEKLSPFGEKGYNKLRKPGA